MPKPIIRNAADVRTRLAGQSMGRFIAALGATPELQDKKLEDLIRDAQSEFESECKIALFRTRIKSAPVNRDLVRRTAQAEGDYDREEDAHTYHIGDFFRGPVSIRLRKRPVVSVDAFFLRWGMDDRTGRLMNFPKGWLSHEMRAGYLHIAALMGGGAATLSGSIIMLPIAGAVMRSNAVPLLIGIDYTAGFLPYDFNPATDDLDDACPNFDNIRAVASGIVALAAKKTLEYTRMAKGAGGGSISIDNISQNHPTGRFEQEIAGLDAEVREAKTKCAEFMGGFEFFME